MKPYYKLMICFFIIGQHSAAQSPVNIYTPKGSLVMDTYISPEKLTAYDIQYINGRLALEYPNAIKLQEATSTYNCHAYAWHMVEGGNPVWMGWSSNPTSIYWTDGSYVEVNSAQGTKVSYASDNHSAITTSDNNVFISKWGAWPLVRHQKDDCPYNSSNLKYYQKASPSPFISGPSSVCDQATYTVDNLPVGATVEWSSSNNILQIVSGQETGTAVFRKKTEGKAKIKARIKYNGSIINIESGWITTELKISISGHDNVKCNTSGLWLASISCAPLDGWGSMHYKWTLENGNECYYGYEPEFVIRTECGSHKSYSTMRAPIDAPHDFYTLHLDVTLHDGSNISVLKSVEIFGYIKVLGKAKAQSFTLSPNPATDEVTLQLTETDEVSGLSVLSTDRSTYEIQIWSGMRMLRSFRTNEPTFQIPMAGHCRQDCTSCASSKTDRRIRRN